MGERYAFKIASELSAWGGTKIDPIKPTPGKQVGELCKHCTLTAANLKHPVRSLARAFKFLLNFEGEVGHIEESTPIKICQLGFPRAGKPSNQRAYFHCYKVSKVWIKLCGSDSRLHGWPGIVESNLLTWMSDPWQKSVWI